MMKKYLIAAAGIACFAVPSLHAGAVTGTVTFLTPGAGIIFHEIESFYPNSVMYTYSSNIWTGSTHRRNQKLRDFAANNVKAGKKVYFVKKRDVETLRLIEICSNPKRNKDGVNRDCDKVRYSEKVVTEINPGVYIVKVNNRWW